MVMRKRMDLKNNPDMQEFFAYYGQIVEKYSSIVSEYGKDKVWEKIEYAGGKRDFGGKSRSRVVRIPADSKVLSDSKVVLIFSTAPKSIDFQCPQLFSVVNESFSASLPLSDISPEKREEYKKTLLENLENLEQMLSKTNT